MLLGTWIISYAYFISLIKGSPMRTRFFLLFILLEFLCMPASAADLQYDKLEIWSLNKDGKAAPMSLTLGQFANYLSSHKASLELLLPEENLLELRVTDPAMNLHEHIANTYVFELGPDGKRALCNHFLLNGQDKQGAELYANTTYLFQIVADEGGNFSSDYKFRITKAAPGFNAPDQQPEGIAKKRPVPDEICGKLLLNMPLDSSLYIMLLEQGDGIRLYFHADEDCQLSQPSICAKRLRNIPTPPQLRKFGIMTPQMSFIQQCHPANRQ